MRRTAWIYIITLMICASLLSLAILRFDLSARAPAWLFIGVVVITTLLRLYRVKTPSHQAYEGSTIGLFSAILLLSPWQYVLFILITHTVEWAIALTRTGNDHLRAWYIQPFNIAKSILSAALVYALFALFPPPTGDTFIFADLIVALLIAASYVAANQLLLGTVLYLARGVSFRHAGIMRDGLAIELPLAAIGFVAVHLVQCDQWLVFFLFAPILLIYQAFMLPKLQHEALQSLEQFNQELSSANEAIQQVNDELFLTLAKIFDARDPYVGSHAAQVAAYAVAIAQELGLSPAQVEVVRQSGYLHDIGKIAIPEAILHKPGKLTKEEYEHLKQHTDLGADFIATSHGLRHLAPFIRHHHERWDGRGYPNGLAGSAIPLEARILNVCDSVEAMASDRPYHRAMSMDQIVAEVQCCAGTQFDPAVAAAFIRVAEREGNYFVVNSARAVAIQQVASDRTLRPVNLQHLAEIYGIPPALPQGLTS